MNEKIYKYADLHSAVLILKNHSVKMSHPDEYNDPFDCSIDYNNEDMNKALTLITEFYMVQEFYKIFDNVNLKTNKFVRAILKWDKLMLNLTLKLSKKMKYFDHISGIHFLSKQFLKKYNNYTDKSYEDLENEFKENIMHKVIELRDDSLLSCFSKKYDSILMWSHYADKHKGICIEFDRPEKDFYDVRYSKKRVRFDLEETTKRILGYKLGNGEVDTKDERLINHIMEPFKTKAMLWNYEDEVRCVFTKKSEGISYNEDNKLFLYNMPTKITKIYVGCKTDKDSEDFKELLRLCADTVKVIYLKQSSINFELAENK